MSQKLDQVTRTDDENVAEPHATDDEPTSEELLEMMQGDPEAVLREHQDLLEEMREETESDILAEYIDARLNKFRSQEGDSR